MMRYCVVPHKCGITYLVINAEGLIRVLYKLVNREGGVVRLDNSVGDLW